MQERESGERFPPRKVTRRSVLGLGASAVGAAAIGTALGVLTAERSNNTPPTLPPEVTPPVIPTSTESEKDPKPSEAPKLFATDEMNEIADSLNLKPGDFFYVNDTLPENYEAHQSEQLFPVFHPRVLEHKDLIYELSDTYEIPVNTIALLMSIESGGDPEANSGVATGLFQLLPEYHMTDIAEKDYNDTTINGERAMNYFTECLDRAREYVENSNPGREYRFQHPDIFLRAYAMYNAGGEGASVPFDELPHETHQYVQHANRFFKVFELASKMRENGMDDDQIVKNLCSSEVDARAKVFQVHNGEYHDPDDLYDFLSADQLPPSNEASTKELVKTYTDYKNGAEPYEYPLNPALRNHAVLGSAFVASDPVNKVLDNWKNMNTARTTA